MGRTPVEKIVDASGDIIVEAGEIISEKHLEEISKIGLRSLKIRSVLTCETEDGICANATEEFSRGTAVNIGEAVGIIAAQSIGEPGTQLTMRTFHIGGAASSSVEQSNLSPIDGQIKLDNIKIIEDQFNNKIVLSRNAKIKIYDNSEEKFSSNIPFGSRLMVSDGENVKTNKILAEWDPYTLPIISEKNGFAKYIDLKQGVSLRESIDDTTGFSSKLLLIGVKTKKAKL